MELPEELASRPPRKSGQEPTATITLEAYARLTAELDELTSSGRSRMAERLKAARELGDIRENAEYDSAKNEQALMGARPADQVSYEAPGGTFRCVVVSFRPNGG